MEKNASDPGLATACDASCPVRLTASLVGYRWTTLIVRDLLSGKKRYSELLRSVSVNQRPTVTSYQHLEIVREPHTI